MKKTLAVLLMAVLSIAAFAAGSAEASQTGSSLMLGMVTDSGTIDDRSFNQGTFEGVQQAADELGLQCTYLRPSGTTTLSPTSMITATGSSHAPDTSSQKLSRRLRRCTLTS